MTTQRVSVEEFAQLHKSGAHILDVRTPAEYRAAHIEGARLCPISDIEPQRLQKELTDQGFQAEDTLYLLCRGGGRATRAAERLAAETTLRVAVVDGGTEACIAAGLPVHRATSGEGISLERQVRIAAGALVLAGVLAGYWITPYGFIFSGLIGAGLIFAGISGTCAMGMLLAKMPWNR